MTDPTAQPFLPDEHGLRRDRQLRLYNANTLTGDRERQIRAACRGADPYGTVLPAWMTEALLHEIDRLRTQLDTVLRQSGSDAPPESESTHERG
ncbi:hypothetical protein [Frondihabitans australicus]|uniref:Uncharacterized protein n=1 Tax=Frondihabitans australicus TaxID=386892 RepID=A0A495IK57_9MICO|nr:hypothetical protein [Frondihabitans australicus]RKR76347.1 hypothetical protein C8E83_3517 [Frondihabitans australicus]